MASSYPGSLDSFTNPTSTDAMDASAALYHDTQHANVNDAVEAIQAELGTDPAGAFPAVKHAIPGHSYWLAYGGHSYGSITSGLRYATGLYPTTNTSLTSQRLYVSRIVVPEAFSCTKLFYCQSVVTATVTGAYIGIYDSSGTKLQEADIASVVTSTGIKSVTITSQSLTAGSAYYLAFLVNASTAGSVTTLPNLESTVFYAGVGDSSNIAAGYLASQTSLPSSITLSSFTRSPGEIWMGVGA